MEYVGKLFDYLVEGMKREYVVYGYDISLWQIFLFVIIACIIGYIIGGIIGE